MPACVSIYLPFNRRFCLSIHTQKNWVTINSDRLVQIVVQLFRSKYLWCYPDRLRCFIVTLSIKAMVWFLSWRSFVPKEEGLQGWQSTKSDRFAISRFMDLPVDRTVIAWSKLSNWERPAMAEASSWPNHFGPPYVRVSVTFQDRGYGYGLAFFSLNIALLYKRTDISRLPQSWQTGEKIPLSVKLMLASGAPDLQSLLLNQERLTEIIYTVPFIWTKMVLQWDHYGAPIHHSDSFDTTLGRHREMTYLNIHKELHHHFPREFTTLSKRFYHLSNLPSLWWPWKIYPLLVWLLCQALTYFKLLRQKHQKASITSTLPPAVQTRQSDSAFTTIKAKQKMSGSNKLLNPVWELLYNNQHDINNLALLKLL